MKKLLYIILAAGALSWAACKSDKDFLQTPPSNILDNDQVWQHTDLVLSVLADLYDRYPDYNTQGNNSNVPSLENWAEFANFDEAFASEAGQYFRHKNATYDYFYPGYQESNGPFGTYWDYKYIRDLNMFIQKDTATTTQIPATDRTRYLAEARFLRAAVYFEEVKRVGGVPIITVPLTYDYSGDVSKLQFPRNKESEVYDFIISELEAIKTDLPNDVNEKSRATKAAALAMESRAALYAGSIAQYGGTKPAVSLPGGEVGISASLANAYYTRSLAASEEIINSNTYSLYNKKADNLSENFASIFYDKGNTEVIFVKDYKLKSGKVEGWTLSNQPRTSQEEQQGSRLNPSLNLVSVFEKLDNTFAPLPIANPNGTPIIYDNPTALFEGRDARLQGTVIVPGASFKGITTDIFAGLQANDGTVYSGDDFGKKIQLPDGQLHQVVGVDGPIDSKELGTQTGFLVRKYMDPSTGSGRIGTQSEVWWVRFRYAEVLLNAAEAAFQLGQPDVAAGYMNQVRRRAGFTIDLTAGQITFDRIVHERKVELAFEGHEFFDYKRWRLADVVWNGVRMTTTDVVSNLGSATRINTMVYALWPYKVYDPGGANDGKWLFKIILPSNVQTPHQFRLGNYYSQIGQDILNNNPKLVKNPNQ